MGRLRGKGQKVGKGAHVICEHQATTPRLSTALPQVKELGVVMYNCSCLARDLTKIFEAYWYLGQAGSSIPSTWPRPYDTRYNQETPMEICLNGTPALAYLAVSLRKEGPGHSQSLSSPARCGGRGVLTTHSYSFCWGWGLGYVPASLGLGFLLKTAAIIICDLSG